MHLKFIITPLTAAVCLCTTLRAESGWAFQDPYPQGNWLNGVSFRDANTGIAVGDSGTIIATSDGGATWTIQDSGSRLRFTAVEHLDATTVLVVGKGGRFFAQRMTVSPGARSTRERPII